MAAGAVDESADAVAGSGVDVETLEQEMVGDEQTADVDYPA